MTNRNLLRLSATLWFVGGLFSLLVGFLHPRSGTPNTHPAQFAAYASSALWPAVQLGQVVGIAGISAGLLVLFFALSSAAFPPRWLGCFGALAAGVTLALDGVLQAVDGVALKQALEAGVSAPAAEKAARLARAEAMRWLEGGTRSYQSFMFGLALLLFAPVLVWTARTPRLIGYLMGRSGLTYLVPGWGLGSEGVSPANTVPTLLGSILVLAWSSWLLLVAWRMQEALPVAPFSAIPPPTCHDHQGEQAMRSEEAQERRPNPPRLRRRVCVRERRKKDTPMRPGKKPSSLMGEAD